MTSLDRAGLLVGIAALITLGGRSAPAQATDACAGSASCVELPKFVATVTDFRESRQGYNRLVTATVKFRNKTDRPLTLGYIQGSGIVTDDRGTRYLLTGSAGVRGIGEITASSFDPKFTLQPGEHSDARFEFIWQPGRDQIYGTSFEIDLAIREIDPVTAAQFRLGKEHALHFRGLGQRAAAGGEVAPAPAPAAPAAPNHPSAEPDPCGARPRCYNAGPFVAEVTQVTASRTSRHHLMRLNVRFRNLTGQPLILAYRAGSGVVIDNLGNRYYWGRAGTYDGSATGIGKVEGRGVDPQFVLNTGESRMATFQLIRYEVGRGEIGTSFAYDLTVVQLEMVPGNQVKVLRDYSVSFKDLTAGMPSADAAQAGAKLLEGLRKKIAKP